MNPLVHSTVTSLICEYYKVAKRYIKNGFDNPEYISFKNALSRLVQAKVAIKNSELSTDDKDEFIKDMNDKLRRINNILGIVETIQSTVDIDGTINYFLVIRTLSEVLDDSSLKMGCLSERIVAKIFISDIYSEYVPDTIQLIVDNLENEYKNYNRAETVYPQNELLNEELYLMTISPNDQEIVSELISSFYYTLKDYSNSTFPMIVMDRIQELRDETKDSVDRYIIDYALFAVMLELDKWLVYSNDYLFTSSIKISESITFNTPYKVVLFEGKC